MYSPIVYMLRTLHVLIAVILTTCLVYLYSVVLTGAAITKYVWLAVAGILAEGLVFFGLGRDCPLSMWQRKLGDEKGFFELFLPPQAARSVLPVLLVLSAVPILLIISKTLR